MLLPSLDIAPGSFDHPKLTLCDSQWGSATLTLLAVDVEFRDTLTLFFSSHLSFPVVRYFVFWFHFVWMTAKMWCTVVLIATWPLELTGDCSRASAITSVIRHQCCLVVDFNYSLRPNKCRPTKYPHVHACCDISLALQWITEWHKR